MEKVEQPLEKNQVSDTIMSTPKRAEPIKEKRLAISYSLDSLKTLEALDTLKVRYNKDERATIFALNRIEEYRVQPGIPVIIPDTISQDFLIYSPFPKELPLLDSIPKAVLIAQRIQGFALYESGKLIHWGPVSSGKKSTPTPNGLHYGNYKAKRKVSTVNDAWILPYYFNFLNFEGVGVHQYNMPGFPASHACVRLKMDDAKFIYDWADMWQLENDTIKHNGTPFMVFGEYDFDAPAPWLNLADDFKADDLTDEELQTLKDYVEQYKEDPRNFRQKEEAEIPETELAS
ncbi:L,D-transpeptidase [Zunongwangia sp. F363]|uniref:L,D-transpeptidase n=1 Tax=Autumnicola tepida TaxID=3075595 RepID=A0ABU3CCW6_9FLAO|nr:L,D-transpeptidase [Zunongwangia sp. F363]MDT0644182.1 L,D-transpeptidase [Zunongwangia sp. F363]